MGLLSRFTSTEEPDKEEDDDEPVMVDIRVHVEREYTQKTVTLHFVDGSEKRIVYDFYKVTNGNRRYQYIDGYDLYKDIKDWYRFNEEHELECEVNMEQVQFIEPDWEEIRFMEGTIEDRVTEERVEKIRSRDQYDVEVLERDVE